MPCGSLVLESTLREGLLNLRYGERFVPQGFENFYTLPAGILGASAFSQKEKTD